MEFNVLVVWVVSTLYGQMLFAEMCDQQRKEDCCYGYKWNKTTHRCEKCSFGFTGQGCTYRCEYPSYGEICSGTCTCDWNLCDFAFGCKVSSQTGIDTPASIHQSKTIPKQIETKTTAVTQAGRRTAKKRPANRIGTVSVSLVSYSTVVLICVSATLLLAYIATYCPRFISIIKRDDKTSSTHNENNNSTYAYV